MNQLFIPLDTTQKNETKVTNYVSSNSKSMKMKILTIALSLLLMPSAFANIFLQSPQKISATEMEDLAKKWRTDFTWNFIAGKFHCYYENAQASFIFSVFHIPICSYNVAYHNFAYIDNLKKYLQKYPLDQQSNYYFEKPLHLEHTSPCKISGEDLFNLLQNQRFIFYTGAGISAAGQVATMATLEESLKLRAVKHSFSLDNLKQFLHHITSNPQEITQAFSDFCQSAIYGAPTHAHSALHEIAQRKQVAIVTENVDLLQQRTGSVPLFVRSGIIQTACAADFQEIDALICIGLSKDDCGFIAHYKKNNPQGKIIAINVGIPDYLSDQDFIVQEDLQVVLPNLARSFIQN
jgi:NAD-dependent deacetylase